MGAGKVLERPPGMTGRYVWVCTPYVQMRTKMDLYLVVQATRIAVWCVLEHNPAVSEVVRRQLRGPGRR